MTFLDSLFESLGVYDPVEQQQMRDQVGQQTGAPAVAPSVPQTTTVGGLTPSQLSGQAAMLAILRRVGVDTPEVVQYVHDLVTSGLSEQQLQDRVDAEQYDSASTIGKVVAEKFPELQARRENGRRLIPIAEILSTRDQIKNVLHTYLPDGMYDSQAEIAQFIGHDRSPAEIDAELKLHAADAFEWSTAGAGASAVSEMQRLYGVGPSSKEVLATYVDPTTAVEVFRQREAAARVSARASNTGFGQLTQAQAERLAAQGVTPEQARAGFNELTSSRELFTALPGENADAITTDEQLAAQFAGNAAAQERIRRRAAERRAAIETGGGYAAGRTGLSGLGAQGA